MRDRETLPEDSNSPKKGLYIKTFGCQMNEYDTMKLKKILEDGYTPVSSPEEASLVLINTCSVRDKPEQKLYSLLGEMRDLKKTNKDLLIGVGGCVAQQEGENIVKKSRAVDFVFGTHNLSLVPSLVELRKNGASPQVAVNYRDEWEDLPCGFPEGKRVSVFVSISRGCNKNCTYCIVPTTRGKEVSRDPSEIEREIRVAVHRGAKEVILLGQTVNSYGLDFKPRSSFSKLLQRISDIDGIKRIRFTSPHPQEVRDDFIDLVSANPKICRHIHMPLQSGSDRILKLMNRNYRRGRYLKIIGSLRGRVPDIAVTTDIIVGFPGETEADFNDTIDVMREARFENSFSFIFSPRPGTPAERMRDAVPREIKLERLQALQALQNEIESETLKSWVGKKAEVLIEGPTQTDPLCYYGRTSQNITLNLVKKYEGLKEGDIVDVAVTATAKHTLKGELAE